MEEYNFQCILDFVFLISQYEIFSCFVSKLIVNLEIPIFPNSSQDMWKHLNCTCCKRHLHRRGKLLASSPRTCYLRELKKILCWNGLRCQCQCRQNIRDFLVIVFSHKFLFLKFSSMPLVYSYEYDNEVHIVNNMPNGVSLLSLETVPLVRTDESENLQQWIPS